MTMLQSLVQRFPNFRGKERRSLSESAEDLQPRSTERKIMDVLGPFESYIVLLQRVLVWEKPLVTAAAIALVNGGFLFWLYAPSFHKVVIVSLPPFALYGYYLWVNNIWPEIRHSGRNADDSDTWIHVYPGVLSLPEISHHLSWLWQKMVNMYKWMKHLSHNKPAVFGLLLLSVFTTIASLMCYMSPFLAAYVLTMIAMLLPGIINYCMRATAYWRDSNVGLQVNAVLAAVFHATESDDMTEYLPERCEETSSELALATAEETPLVDTRKFSELPDELDELPSNSLLFCPSVPEMPSHDDDVEADESESGQLLSTLQHVAAVGAVANMAFSGAAIPLVEKKAVKSGEGALPMTCTHYSELDSSDDEESFAKGLCFVVADAPDGESDFQKKATSVSTHSEKECDTALEDDFEMISEEELA